MFGPLQCYRTRRLLWDYGRGRLPEADLERVERHLQRCRRCLAESADYGAAVRYVDAYREQPTPAPHGSWAAVHARLIAPPRHAAPAPGQRRRSWAAAGVALCAALAFGWWWTQRRTAPPGQTLMVDRPGNVSRPPLSSAPR